MYVHNKHTFILPLFPKIKHIINCPVLQFPKVIHLINTGKKRMKHSLQLLQTGVGEKSLLLKTCLVTHEEGKQKA